MASPTIESYTDISHSGVAFDVAKPSGLEVGELLLAIIAKDDDISMSPPAGWVTDFDGSGNSGLACSSYAFHKVADSGDVAASVFTFTGDNEDYVGRLYRISGIDIASPIDAVDSTGNSGASATPQALTIDTNTDDALVFAFTGMDDNDTPYTLETGGWTEDLNTDKTTSGIVIGRKVMATAGGTGAVDFTTNASDGWVASQIAIKPVGAVGYTLTADSGGLTLSGQDITPLVDRLFGVGSGGVTLTGQDVTFAKGYSFIVESGDFLLTGQDVTFPLDYLLSIDTCSFTLAGQDVGLLHGLLISVESGDFALVGQDITFPKGFSLTVESGSCVLSGQDIILTANRALSVDTVSIILNGQNVSLLKGYKIVTEFADYALVGQDAGLVYTPAGLYILSVDSGDFAFTGQDLAMLAGRVLVPNNGAYAIDGQDISIFYDKILNLDSGDLTLAGQDVFLTYMPVSLYKLVVNTGSFTFTGHDSDLKYTNIFTADGKINVEFFIKSSLVTMELKSSLVTTELKSTETNFN